jgi:hypothetical protein
MGGPALPVGFAYLNVDIGRAGMVAERSGQFPERLIEITFAYLGQGLTIVVSSQLAAQPRSRGISHGDSFKRRRSSYPSSFPAEPRLSVKRYGNVTGLWLI